MKTVQKFIPTSQDIHTLLLDDNLENIKGKLNDYNSHSPSNYSELISNIININMYSASLELFQFYIDNYQSLNEEEKNSLNSISKNCHIHPYCKALICQYLYEANHNLNYLRLAYDSFILAFKKNYKDNKTYFKLLLHLVIIHVSFNKQIGKTPQIHDKILEFSSLYHIDSLYKVLNIAYKNHIITPEETIVICKDYIDNIEDLNGMHEVIGKYINLLKMIKNNKKVPFDTLVDLKRMQWKQIESIEKTLHSIQNKNSDFDSTQMQLEEVKILKEIDFEGTKQKRKDILKERYKKSIQLANNLPYHDFEIDIKKELDELYFQLGCFDNKISLLRGFLNIPFINSKDVYKNAEYYIKNCLTIYFPQQIFDINGRVIFKSNGWENNQDNSALTSQIRMKQYHYSLSFISFSYIHKTHKYMKENFKYSKDDIESIINQSEFVPKNRRALYLKGIWAGFNNDYSTALHILVPQFENSIRELSIIYGDYPYKVDDSGIESSLSLENIVSLQTIQELFDDDLLLAIQYLFCNNLGLNARNYIAHGLFDSDFFYSYEAIYTWWFIFKVCYIFSY